jgi:hypothetical protein
MNLQRLAEDTIARMVIGAVKAPTAVRRLFITLGRRIMSAWRPSVSHAGSDDESSDDGTQGAGVAAPLLPRPPVLAAAAANALPGPGEEGTA